MKGTIAIEEAIIDPSSLPSLSQWSSLLSPSLPSTPHQPSPITLRLQDIHTTRLQSMDAHGVEYMLLSLTAPGCQGEPKAALAAQMARAANDYLSSEAAKNPTRFGALAALSMHSAEAASEELRRAVSELGMFGALVNDFQSVDMGQGEGGGAKRWLDGPEYRAFWEVVQELDVPVYLHPRYPDARDLAGERYGARKHLLGAGVQFHLDLSWHVYALCSSGLFDSFPRLKVVVGHLGENIPFNLWRACHWYNSPLKKSARPSRHDYKHYFTHNIFITTSGNFSTRGLKYCIEELGVDRCLYSIDYPYESIQDAQAWWKSVDLPAHEKELVARTNAIRLYKLPLEE